MVAGKLTIDKISKLDSAKTLQGQEIKINARKWHLHVPPKINDASITNTDILADNGVIHVLDRVLMPDMALTCMVCGMGFMTMEVLNNHTQVIHMAKKMSSQIRLLRLWAPLKKPRHQCQSLGRFL